MSNSPAVRLAAYEETDLGLTLACERDPVAMRHLGGPRDEEGIRAAHGKRMRADEDGGAWKTIVVAPSGERVGTIGFWRSEHGGPIWEAGWMLLPSQHGRGIGTRALALIIELARERDLGELHAFPGQENEASNALCRSAGFELIGTDQGEFAGKPIVSNHWRLTLQRPPEPGPGG